MSEVVAARLMVIFLSVAALALVGVATRVVSAHHRKRKHAAQLTKAAMEPIYGLKMLTAKGVCNADEYPYVTYPVGKWVKVPGNGSYVAMTDGLSGTRKGHVLTQFECKEPTGADAPDGVTCFRRVKRLAQVDIEWVKTLSDDMRYSVAWFGAAEHRNVLRNDPDPNVRWRAEYSGAPL